MEVVSATGRVLWTFPLGASISPRNTDEGLCSYMRHLEQLSPHPGSFEALLKGLPGIRVVNLFDKGRTTTGRHCSCLIYASGFFKTAFNTANRPGFQDELVEMRNQNPNMSFFFPTTNKGPLLDQNLQEIPIQQNQNVHRQVLPISHISYSICGVKSQKIFQLKFLGSCQKEIVNSK